MTMKQSFLWEIAPAFVCALTMFAFINGTTTAHAASSQEAIWYSSSCPQNGKNPQCGVIVLVNGGVYTVTKTHLHALSPQGGDYTAAPGCTETNKEWKNDLPAANYYTFVVPADCGYETKMNIKDGPVKDQKVFLTPGCLLRVQTGGDLISGTSYKVKDVSWTDAAKAAGKSGTVQDSAGKKCGNYGER